MLILAIETSCDETAVAIMKNRSGSGKLLSHLVASQTALHAKTGGVVPEIAARAHIETIIPLMRRALKKAAIDLKHIQIIAVTAGPGLAPSLMVGVDTAKALAMGLNVPLIAVNHIEAHLFSPFLSTGGYRLPNIHTIFPAVSLVVSGGHTELFLVSNWLKYKKLGATVDDAAGECFDKIAKLLKLSYPGGPALSRLAAQGQANINFPRPMINSKDFNFSFSGLKTAVFYYLKQQKPTNQQQRANIAASAQAAIIDVLITKTLTAAKKYQAKSILLGGGVAANQILRQQLETESFKLKTRLLIARPEFCTDNAAMIALIASLRSDKKRFTPLNKLSARPGWEL